MEESNFDINESFDDMNSVEIYDKDAFKERNDIDKNKYEIALDNIIEQHNEDETSHLDTEMINNKASEISEQELIVISQKPSISSRESLNEIVDLKTNLNGNGMV
jgi:hypothetical protein